MASIFDEIDAAADQAAPAPTGGAGASSIFDEIDSAPPAEWLQGMVGAVERRRDLTEQQKDNLASVITSAAQGGASTKPEDVERFSENFMEWRRKTPLRQAMAADLVDPTENESKLIEMELRYREKAAAVYGSRDAAPFGNPAFRDVSADDLEAKMMDLQTGAPKGMDGEKFRELQEYLAQVARYNALPGPSTAGQAVRSVVGGATGMAADPTSLIPAASAPKAGGALARVGISGLEGATIGGLSAPLSSVGAELTGEEEISFLEGAIGGAVGGALLRGVIEGGPLLIRAVTGRIRRVPKSKLTPEIAQKIAEEETAIQRRINERLGVGRETKSATESAASIESMPKKSAAESAGAFEDGLPPLDTPTQTVEANTIGGRTAEESAAAMGVLPAKSARESADVFTEAESARVAALSKGRVELMDQAVAESQTLAGRKMQQPASTKALGELERRIEFNQLQGPDTIAPDQPATASPVQAVPEQKVKLSPQAQRMVDQYGRVSPRLMTSVAGGGTGVVYGFSQGETPEERIQNAAKYGLMGLAGGFWGGSVPKLLTRPSQSQYGRYVKEMAVGIDKMPQWYLNLRQTGPMVKLRELLKNPRAIEKDLVSNVVRAGGTVPETANPMLASRLAPGIIRARIEQEAEAAAQEVVANRDLAAEAWSKQTGAKPQAFMDRLNEYLHARTAPAYNAAHADYTLSTGTPAAGMSDSDAAAVLSRAQADGLDTVFDDLHRQLREMDDATLDALVEGQLISPAQADGLRTKYPDHLPLNREVDADEVLQGGSRSVPKFGGSPSTGVRKGFGSDLAVTDLYANVLTNLKDAIIRAEKNKVTLAAADFFTQHPTTGVTVRKPKVIGSSGDKPILEPLIGPKADTVMVGRRVKDPAKPSEQVWIEFDNPAMAKAFRGTNIEQAGMLMRWVGTGTRFLSSLYTFFSAPFTVSNKLRDVQEAFTEVATSGDWRSAGSTLMKSFPAMVDVAAARTGKATPGARLYEQAARDGAFTGGYATSTRDESVKTIAGMSRFRNPVVKAKDATIGFFEFINAVAEDSTRLAAYRRALEVGATRKEAALASRDIGPDFDLAGTLTKQASALWAFANPSAQGGIKAVKSVIRNPKVIGELLMGGVALGIIIDRWNSGFDPQWKEKRVNKFYRQTGFPVIVGEDDEGYYMLTVPTAQALRPIKAVADLGVDLSQGAVDDIGSAVKQASQTALQTLNPIGGESFRQMVTPTVLDPLSDIWANESFSGSAIRPQAQPGQPAFSQVYDRTMTTSAGQAAMATARLLADIGIDASPEDLLYAVKGYAGGPGELAQQVGNVGLAVAGERNAQIRDIPMVSRFIKYVPKDARVDASSGDASMIRNIQVDRADAKLLARQDSIELEERIKTMDSKAKVAEILRVAKENPRAVEMLRERAVRRSVGLTDVDRQIGELGVEDGTRARFIIEKLRQLEPKDRAALLVELQTKGLLTDRVREQLQQYAQAVRN